MQQKERTPVAGRSSEQYHVLYLCIHLSQNQSSSLHIARVCARTFVVGGKSKVGPQSIINEFVGLAFRRDDILEFWVHMLTEERACAMVEALAYTPSQNCCSFSKV